LVNALCKSGLSRDEATDLLTGDHTVTKRNSTLLDVVSDLRVLDPACGSGAFLVHALERIALLRMSLGEVRPLSDVRRAVLTNSIFGVDANATAVWLCELRLWLSVVIDSGESDPMRISPLPNLDRQIRVGDSLSGDTFEPTNPAQQQPRSIAAMNRRYARATGRRKVALGKQLDVAERERGMAAIDSAISRARTERKDILSAVRAKDLFNTRRTASHVSRDRLLQLRTELRSLRQQRTAIARGGLPAFSYPTHFASVARAGGFDIVIGNPPWVRIHNISPHARAKYREQFTTYRASAWLEGARSAKAGSGFAGQVDLAALFLERSVDLLAPTGTVGLLLPAKLWRSLAGGGARRLVLERTDIHAIEDHSAGPDMFQAAVYPSMLVAGRRGSDHPRSAAVAVSVQQRATVQRWTAASRDFPLDASPGSPWLVIPPIARKAFDRIGGAGVPLFESVMGRPHLGVKTGCNDAFLVRAGEDVSGLTPVSNNSRHGNIETDSLRPLLRGESLERWRVGDTRDRIVWTHASDGVPLRRLPPHAERWLAHSRRALECRSDSHSARWWSLFRIEAARSNAARVVWGDFGRTPCAAVIDPGSPVVPLNTCYSIHCERVDDALAFCALLNSDVAAAWLAALAEPARGGYHRYLGWTIARLPVPIDWPRARLLLAPIAARAREGQSPSAAELREAVLSAYKLTIADVQALLSWTHASTDD
ncbi:MAG: N-6 DNA methylase, partial [Gemmatimonadaceae bacterium]